jgi:class 3 adenylate cyclase
MMSDVNPRSPVRKTLGSPDELIEFPGIVEELVEIGELTVGRTTQAPGWRWSTHVRPLVGGDWCEAHHVGIVLSGRWGAQMRDGTELEFGPEDVYDVPPGHDGYTLGDEPAVLIEWSGLRSFARRHLAFPSRVLATLLFTDLVESTALATEMGDVRWREALGRHYAGVRSVLERFNGREVATTGDGILALFDGPAVALRCAAAIRAGARLQGLGIRIGVHVGEVEAVGTNVRGIAVHEAARIMGEAAAGEILLSETTRALVGRTDLLFEDRGVRRLKGLSSPMKLLAYIDEGIAKVDQ